MLNTLLLAATTTSTAPTSAPAVGQGLLYFILITIFVALVFDFLNGFHDAANSIATIVSTRVLSPFAAVAWAGTGVMTSSNSTAVLVILSAISLVILGRLIAACRSPAPQRVQGAVKLMLMSYVLLDAALVLSRTGDVVAALLTAALLIPAMLAGRWLYVT